MFVFLCVFFYAVVRQISLLFIDNKDSVFCVFVVVVVVVVVLCSAPNSIFMLEVRA